MKGGAMMTAQKKVAGGYHTTTATAQTHVPTVATTEADNKAFATLAARFALSGHSLMRGNPADGAAAFYAMRWGYLKVLPTLDAAHAFLDKIGGSQ